MKTTLPPTLRHLFTLLLILLLTAACRHEAPMTNRLVDHRPPIFPDYTEVTIPPNIAPLRFLLSDTCDVDKAAATFECGAERVTVWASDGRSIAIAPRAWKRLMKDAAGKVISVKVTARIAGEWVGYAPFNLYVATDSIDPYIVYGRTDPSRNVMGHTGLYSRCLEDFRERAVLTSDMTRGDRIGPATFSGGDAQRFFLPLSGALSCALLTDSDKIEKLNTHTIPGLPTPTHVAWHPSGRYMAFAVNRNARQDARETASRIVIYDVVKHELFTSPQLFSDSSSVTYPAFSPDGETLYFCATSLMAHTHADSAKYHLCALAFNIHGGRRFGRKADTLYHSRPAPPPPPRKKSDKTPPRRPEVRPDGSAARPLPSPDGRYLLFTVADVGSNPADRPTSDVALFDIKHRNFLPVDTLCADNDSEIAYSWSNNGRWIVYTTRSIDGLYEYPVIAHLSADGRPSKPFLLPLKEANGYRRTMRSFAHPTFLTAPVPYRNYTLSRKARTLEGVDIQPLKAGK